MNSPPKPPRTQTGRPPAGSPPAASLLALLALLLQACSDGGVPLEPLPPGAVILAFGDSLTRGNGAPAAQSYPAQLQRLLGRRVINAGVPGEVSAQGVARLPALLDRHAPDLLILCHGGNDLLRRVDPRQTRRNLAAMIGAAQARDIPVVLVGVPRPALFFLDTDSLYDEVAAEFGLPYEDRILAEVMADGGLMADPLHPNAHGYRRIAESLAERMQHGGGRP